jgi:hypothetical protein
MTPQIWIALPVEADADDWRGRRERLNDGDSYIVELADGEQLWAVYSRAGGFVPCDDDGNEIARSGLDSPLPLDDVARVLVRGYRAGFGPSCPVAGAAPRVRLVVTA